MRKEVITFVTQKKNQMDDYSIKKKVRGYDGWETDAYGNVYHNGCQLKLIHGRYVSIHGKSVPVKEMMMLSWGKPRNIDGDLNNNSINNLTVDFLNN